MEYARTTAAQFQVINSQTTVNIHQEELNKFIESMQRKCQIVIDAHTMYVLISIKSNLIKYKNCWFMLNLLCRVYLY